MRWGRPWVRLIGFGWLVLLGASCETTEDVVEENAGEVCLYKLGEELVIHVTRRGCLSGSCDTDRVGQCTVGVDGSDVTLESRFSFTTQSSGDCTADCGTIIARCTAPLPPDGPVTVHFGAQSGEVVRDADGAGTFGEPRPGPPGFNACHVPPHLI
jgi:hypothetical protein